LSFHSNASEAWEKKKGHLPHLWGKRKEEKGKKRSLGGRENPTVSNLSLMKTSHRKGGKKKGKVLLERKVKIW